MSPVPRRDALYSGVYGLVVEKEAKVCIFITLALRSSRLLYLDFNVHVAFPHLQIVSPSSPSLCCWHHRRLDT